jgi:hypothetical protein
MVFVTAVHLTGGTGHEHIAGVRWLDCSNSTSRSMSTAQAVGWLHNGNQLWVADQDTPAEVKVVSANPPHLRTVANGQYTDNLLNLPRY